MGIGLESPHCRPFVNVLQAQCALLNAQDQLTQSDALVVTALVAIHKALGGGCSR
jgi:outer membrane protein TolC